MVLCNGTKIPKENMNLIAKLSGKLIMACKKQTMRILSFTLPPPPIQTDRMASDSPVTQPDDAETNGYLCEATPHIFEREGAFLYK